MIRFYTFVKDKTQARHPSSATSYQPLFLRVFLRFFAANFLLDSRFWTLVCYCHKKSTDYLEVNNYPSTFCHSVAAQRVGEPPHISFFASSCASSRLISCSTLDSGRSTGLNWPQKCSKFTKERVERPAPRVEHEPFFRHPTLSIQNFFFPATRHTPCHAGAARRIGRPPNITFFAFSCASSWL
jgi:hypothetical protein